MKRTKKLESIYTLEFTKKRLGLTFIGGLFVLLWMFALGVIAGRYIYPPYFDAELSSEPQVIANTYPVKKRIPKPEFTFPEKLLQNPDQIGIMEGHFSLQVGAFKDPDNARGVAERLRHKGYDAYVITPGLSRSEPWHKVRVGHFDTKKEAEALLSEMGKTENTTNIIIVEGSR